MQGYEFRAAVLGAPGTFEVKNVNIAALEPGSVLVKVAACGICGSDLNIYHRDPPIPMFWPGHEISGTVAEVGLGVEDYKAGDRVTVSPLLPCGECAECLSGRENICSDCLFISFNLPGGFAEYLFVPETNIFKLPESVAFEDAVLLEPLADVLHAFELAGGIEGRNLVVMGCGTFGLLVVSAATALGAGSVSAVGKHAFQRQLALSLGASSVFDPEDDQLARKVLESHNGVKSDIVFETVGGYASSSITQAVELLLPGGTIMLSGVHYSTPEMNLKNLTEREITVKGTQRYKRDDFLSALALFEKGEINVEGLVTASFSLDHISEAYEAAMNKATSGAVKVVVCP